MATDQPSIEKGNSGLVRRLFLDHPRSLGMSWAGHGAGAVKIGAELIGAGFAAIVHAIVPGWFTETAGKTVTRIYDHIQERKAGADNPDNWPDYEI
ncbi:MAG TPA: DUF6356 family protein [Sphingomicrobium sp.]|nr:DUF6356 family protein [Sphingomicrobium sp.]